MHILKVMGWYLHPSLVAPAGGEQDSGALGGSLIISQISSRNVYQIVSRTIWEKLPSFRQKDKIKASQGYLLAYAVRSCCHFLDRVLNFPQSLHIDFVFARSSLVCRRGEDAVYSYKISPISFVKRFQISSKLIDTTHARGTSKTLTIPSGALHKGNHDISHFRFAWLHRFKPYTIDDYVSITTWRLQSKWYA